MQDEIKLIEHTPKRIPGPPDWNIGIELHKNYAKYIKVDRGLRTDNDWQFVPRGIVGYIPVSRGEAVVSISPKFEINNLFEMISYAFQIENPLIRLSGIYNCQMLSGYNDFLAKTLSEMVLKRISFGLYNEYVEETGKLQFLRGRVNYSKSNLDAQQYSCKWTSLTTDILDNQIITWTLLSILRTGLCSQTTEKSVKQAFKQMEKYTTAKDLNVQDVVNKQYNKLNKDYEVMHRFCSYFLTATQPSHKPGNQIMIPFLLNMEQLYQSFFAQWLKKNLPNGFKVEIQQSLTIEGVNSPKYTIDIIMKYNSQVVAVLDTKYKRKIYSSDTQQVGFYGVLAKAKEAIIVYPFSEDMKEKEINFEIEGLRVRSILFDLNKDISTAGKEFLCCLKPENYCL